MAEILAWTDVKEVDPSYTKEMTQNIHSVIFSQEFRQCHSPFLTLVLIGEFLKLLSKADALH